MTHLILSVAGTDTRFMERYFSLLAYFGAVGRLVYWLIFSSGLLLSCLFIWYDVSRPSRVALRGTWDIRIMDTSMLGNGGRLFCFGRVRQKHWGGFVISWDLGLTSELRPQNRKGEAWEERGRTAVSCGLRYGSWRFDTCTHGFMTVSDMGPRVVTLLFYSFFF